MCADTRRAYSMPALIALALEHRPDIRAAGAARSDRGGAARRRQARGLSRHHRWAPATRTARSPSRATTPTRWGCRCRCRCRCSIATRPTSDASRWTSGAPTTSSSGCGLSVAHDVAEAVRQRGSVARAARRVRGRRCDETETAAPPPPASTPGRRSRCRRRRRCRREKRGMLERAETALRVAEKSYQAGAISLLELLDAQRTYLDVRGQYLRALYDYRQAAIDVNHAVGRGEVMIASERLSCGAPPCDGASLGVVGGRLRQAGRGAGGGAGRASVRATSCSSTPRARAWTSSRSRSSRSRTAAAGCRCPAASPSTRTTPSASPRRSTGARSRCWSSSATRCKAGQPLIQLSSPDVGQIQADAQKALTDLSIAEKAIERVHKLQADGAALGEGRRAGRGRLQEGQVRLRARRGPAQVAGHLGHRPGGQRRAARADPRRRRRAQRAGRARRCAATARRRCSPSAASTRSGCSADAYEQDLGLVTEGAKVSIRVPAYPGRDLPRPGEAHRRRRRPHHAHGEDPLRGRQPRPPPQARDVREDRRRDAAAAPSSSPCRPRRCSTTATSRWSSSPPRATSSARAPCRSAPRSTATSASSAGLTRRREDRHLGRDLHEAGESTVARASRAGCGQLLEVAAVVGLLDLADAAHEPEALRSSRRWGRCGSRAATGTCRRGR